MGSCRKKQVPKVAGGDGTTSWSPFKTGDCQVRGDRVRYKVAWSLREGTAHLEEKLEWQCSLSTSLRMSFPDEGPRQCMETTISQAQ